MSILSTVPKGAAVEGINPNLLRNWYFVGGGTGRGVFPVNSRGQTSYTAPGGSNYYTIDGWLIYSGSTPVTINSNNIILGPRSNDASSITQFLQIPFIELSGKQMNISCLLSDGTLITATNTLPSTVPTSNIVLISAYGPAGSSGYVARLGYNNRFYFILQTSANSSLSIVAVKLELGDQQTLAHQENGVWILNEIPDYETEYYRCITSDADSTDTYANQKVSNITVQCNSVGSSSLRYYNNLIQSTHKVLDSTFSNPAAQTSDITVTTYDGYLDFSNGFASGATTNITLVLGTSGPVLSTSTTAPS